MSYIGNFNIIEEPIIIETLADSKTTSVGDFNIISEPFIIEQLATSKTTSIGDKVFFANDVDISLEVFTPSSFIIKPSNIALGQDNIFILDAPLLSVETKVAAHPSFSNISNWKWVYITYDSSDGQSNGIAFKIKGDTVSTTFNGNFNPTEKAISGSDWTVTSVTLVDFDKGFLHLKRDDLDTASFDIFNLT